jgi:hypothetical protein
MKQFRTAIFSAMSLLQVLALSVSGAMAQQERNIKDRLAGTWSLVSLVATQGEKKIDLFGGDPRGKMILTADGHFSTLTTRSTLPKFASNNRTLGTPEEYQAIMQGANAHYGTYTIDEANKTIVFRIEVSTFPNWEGQGQQRLFTLSGDVLSYVNPTSTVGAPSVHAVWKRMN